MTIFLLSTSALSFVLLAGLCVYLSRTVSRLSKKDTPTPTTKPAEPTFDPMTMMTAMGSMMMTWATEMREMVTTMVLGREQPQPTSQMVMPPTPNGKVPDYDDDSIPLSPGLARILEREVEESEQTRLSSERSLLQQRLGDLINEAANLGIEDLGDFLPRHSAEEQQDPGPG